MEIKKFSEKHFHLFGLKISMNQSNSNKINIKKEQIVFL